MDSQSLLEAALLLRQSSAQETSCLCPIRSADRCIACAGNIIVTPYSGSQELFHMVRGVDADKTPLPSERTKLVFFRGHCGPWENVAKRMRHAMVGALRQGNTSDVDACCLGKALTRAIIPTNHLSGAAFDHTVVRNNL